MVIRRAVSSYNGLVAIRYPRSSNLQQLSNSPKALPYTPQSTVYHAQSPLANQRNLDQERRPSALFSLQYPPILHPLPSCSPCSSSALALPRYHSQASHQHPVTVHVRGYIVELLRDLVVAIGRSGRQLSLCLLACGRVREACSQGIRRGHGLNA